MSIFPGQKILPIRRCVCGHASIVLRRTEQNIYVVRSMFLNLYLLEKDTRDRDILRLEGDDTHDLIRVCARITTHLALSVFGS